MYDPVLGETAKRKTMATTNGNTKEGDGVLYAGKGYVQITWKNNYKKLGDVFGVDLVANPELALDPQLSLSICLYGFDNGSFTYKDIHSYINEEKTDYFNARRVINGVDKAELIKGYAEKFEKCLKINILTS